MHVLLAISLLSPATQGGQRFPLDSGIVDITRAPYGAAGNGKRDDTEVIQRAILDHAGSRKTIFFPNGTYRITRPLLVPNKNRQGNWLYGLTHLRGETMTGAVLRLDPGSLTDPQKPDAIVDYGRHGSADWFANSVENLTFRVGPNNPGAIGLRFYSNNTGVIRNVAIESEDGKGVIGLDLGYNDMNGPLLVQRTSVKGFRLGIASGNTVNSQTFHRISLTGQTEAGLVNNGQPIAIEGLTSNNTVPAIANNWGLTTLIGADLKSPTKASAAITGKGDLFGRDVRTSGYAEPIPGGSEFSSEPTIQLFPGSRVSAKLANPDAPDVPWDAPTTWKSPFDFGIERQEGKDISDGLQAAIDSGATTVYIPTGAWRISKTITLRKNVRRLIGMHSYLIPEDPLNSQDAPMFRVAQGAAPVVVIQDLSWGFGNKAVYGVQNDSAGTVVLRDLECYTYKNRVGAGPLFLENVCGGPFFFTKQVVNARQLNQETEGTHVRNDGGTLRILGFKTERGGTLIETIGGGTTEVLGGFSYTTTAGKLAPMFVTKDSNITVSFAERCYSGDPYTQILSETRAGVTKTMANTDPRYRGRLILYVGRGNHRASADRKRADIRPNLLDS
ncbi:MAG: glycosyl hydrolase family 28-related protein [Fimbriimonas sp.]